MDIFTYKLLMVRERHFRSGFSRTPGLNADANKNLVDSMETAERVDKSLAAAAHRPSILKSAKTPSPQSLEGGSRTATPISFNLVTINVSGRRYQTFAETLERYPDTLLGNPNRRMLFFNSSTNEYFFDRHRTCFEAILYFYQSPGRLRRPEAVPVDIFVNELRFFEMGDEVIEKFWILEGYRKPKFVALPKNKFQCKVYQLLEQPDSSMCARIVAFFSVFVIVLSTTSFCLETIPKFREIYNRTRDDFILHNTTLELLCRFVSCPNKCTFCTSILNIIDLIAIVPFFINLAMQSQNTLVRVFRIFKLSRHSRGLQILGKTFKASVQELCLLVFFMMIALVLFSSAVYFAEQKTNPQFESIPATFWFTIATMTTVGYGDLTPKGASGKVVGGMCALVGVLVLALPVPVIVANFKHFYHQEKRLAHMHRVEQSEKEEESIDEESRSS
uniref:BTB domain-containing protein n=1 Tax=Romanomermis culicivorax TaxID=13658 RepID=A0A915KIW9_ROMCU